MSKILVWDLPLRLFHWLLVMLVVVSVVSAKIGGNAMQVHMLSGYTILTLVLFRILWGFAGSTHARFASFVRGPAAVIAYLRGLTGHEAGQHDISTEGPLAKLVSKALSDRITGVHHLNVKLLFALIALHLSAVAFYLIHKRENLVKPMLTGFKDADNGAGDVAQKRGKTWLAAVLLAACAGGVYLLLRLPAA
jgi:cytochrome b